MFAALSTCYSHWGSNSTRTLNMPGWRPFSRTRRATRPPGWHRCVKSWLGMRSRWDKTMADDKPLQQFYEALKHPVGASNHAAGHPDVCVPPQKPAQAPPLQAISQEKSLAPTMPDVEIIDHLNSNGKLVLRGLVNNEDDLLRVAEYHAGEGGLDKWKKMKPDFWESPDGMREIEWNPQ